MDKINKTKVEIELLKLKKEEIISIIWLLKKGAIDEKKSDVTIKDFWTTLEYLHDCKITQARKYYYKLKQDGFIESKQVGKNSSKVWIK